jgi:hypothetical protein
MLPTSGSSEYNVKIAYNFRVVLLGFGSESNDVTDRRTFEIVRAGLQLSFKISRQIAPLWFISN